MKVVRYSILVRTLVLIRHSTEPDGDRIAIPSTIP
jgi:hypothetical protein